VSQAASLVIIYAQAFDVLRDKSDDTAAIAIASVAKAWYARTARTRTVDALGCLAGRQSQS
jgi:hypothetical protein